MLCHCERSPSMRREWIEISDRYIIINLVKSPSMRREWIEMTLAGCTKLG